MSRINYWSCSAFADWLRGAPKLKAATWEEWEKWEADAKATHPVRYWIAEELLNKVQNVLYWPSDKLYQLKYYISNRFFTKTHCLVADPGYIRPGSWRDLSDRFLPCMFGSLVDYVEIELAHQQIVWNNPEKKKYNPPFWANGWFCLRTWRCAAAGIDHLSWQAGLIWTELELESDDPRIGKPTPQAVAAQEVLDLYRWWTLVYANRPDPYEVSGWSDYCSQREKENNGKFSFGESRSPELVKQRKRAFRELRKVEEAYRREDEAMMIRLIKIRESLWT